MYDILKKSLKMRKRFIKIAFKIVFCFSALCDAFLDASVRRPAAGQYTIYFEQVLLKSVSHVNE